MTEAQLSQLDLSKRLRQLMLHHDLTVAQLADLGGVSKSAMEKYLSGPSSPRAVTLANICRALAVSPSWLMFGETETDEVAEAVAFTTSVFEEMIALLTEIRSEPELLEAFQTARPRDEKWDRLFKRDVTYRHAKRALAAFRDERESVFVSASIEFKRDQS